MNISLVTGCLYSENITPSTIGGERNSARHVLEHGRERRASREAQIFVFGGLGSTSDAVNREVTCDFHGFERLGSPLQHQLRTILEAHYPAPLDLAEAFLLCQVAKHDQKNDLGRLVVAHFIFPKNRGAGENVYMTLFAQQPVHAQPRGLKREWRRRHVQRLLIRRIQLNTCMGLAWRRIRRSRISVSWTVLERLKDHINGRSRNEGQSQNQLVQRRPSFSTPTNVSTIGPNIIDSEESILPPLSWHMVQRHRRDMLGSILPAPLGFCNPNEIMRVGYRDEEGKLQFSVFEGAKRGSCDNWENPFDRVVEFVRLSELSSCGCHWENISHFTTASFETRAWTRRTETGVCLSLALRVLRANFKIDELQRTHPRISVMASAET
ncbi:hypothetical protein GALMADRAFT_217729, partial [Galerina marginata CBS 339.88]